MLGFSLSRQTAPNGILVTVQLNARLQPLDRGDMFEDELHDFLSSKTLGEVTGGGSLQSDEGWIIQSDIEIDAASADPETLKAITTRLEELGAPRGSKLVVEQSGDEFEFGTQEGLAIYLNGTDLPDEVDENCDVGHIIDELNRLLKGTGKYFSYWDGPTETALYLYGSSAALMRERIEPLLDSYPLCQGARTEQIA